MLGQDDGNRIKTGNPFTAAKTKDANKAKLQVVPNRKKPETRAVVEKVPNYPEPKIKDKKLQDKIKEIKDKFPDFSAGHFVFGAQAAFEMVLEAFSTGDKDTLKGLLAKELYQDFEKEIDKRAKSGKQSCATLVAINASDIKKVSFDKNVADITVSFKSEQINVVKDKEGKIVGGNASAVDEVQDSWTFRRNMASSNPNWTIVSLDS